MPAKLFITSRDVDKQLSKLPLKININNFNKNYTNYNKIYNKNYNKIYNKNYTNLLINILQKNIQIPCNKSVFKKYIVFEEYFDKNIIKGLFRNYLEMIVFTLKFIYE